MDEDKAPRSGCDQQDKQASNIRAGDIDSTFGVGLISDSNECPPVLYCLCHSDSASVSLYLTFIVCCIQSVKEF